MSHKVKPFKALYPLLLLVIIDTMGIGIIFPVLSPLFMRPGSGLVPANASLGERDILYGVVLGAFAVFMFFAAPFLGDLSDRIGRKKVLLICLVGTALSSFLCAAAINVDSLILLFIGRIFAGMTAGSQPIAQAAIIDLSHPENKTKNLGLMALAGCIGFVFGPILGGFFAEKNIVHWFNYATPFYVDGLLALFNAGLLVYTLKETHKASDKAPMSLMQNIKIFTDAFKNKSIRNLSLMLLLYELSWSLYFQYIAIFLVQKYNSNAEYVGLYLSYMGVFLGFTFLVIIRILLKFMREGPIVLWSMVLSTLAMILPVFFESQLAQWWIIIPIVIGVGLTYNAMLALFSNSVADDKQGWVMGVTTAVVSMSWILGSFMVGALSYIDIVAPFIAASILMGVAVVIYLVAKTA